MTLLVYKNKETGAILSYEVLRRDVPQDAIDRFNADEKNIKIAEKVEVKEGSLLHVVITAKQRSLSDYLEDIRDLENAISDISSRLDEKLYDLERRVKTVEEEE